MRPLALSLLKIVVIFRVFDLSGSVSAQMIPTVSPNDTPHFYLGPQLLPDGDTATLLPDGMLIPGITNCSNSDFSEGTFYNWSGCYGSFDNPCENVGFHPTRHVIMPHAGQTYDPFIGAPLTTLFPGETHSARLGDTLEGGHSEELRYTVAMTPDNMLFIYRWASVLESVGHEMWQMPKFALQVEDMAGNAIGGSCGFYEFIAPNCSPPGPSCIVPPEWHYFAVPSPNIDLYWHDWTTIALDLTPFQSLGQVQIVFTTRGCALQIHRGYAYLSTYCSPLDIQISMCTGSTQATLTAPPGFAGYAWRGPGLTGPPVGTSQSIIITNPQPNDKYYVDLTAANGCMVNDLSQEILATVVNADFTYVPHCAGEATTFLDISTINQNDVVYWHWMFGDGQPDLGGIPDPTHVYSLPGTYTATLHAYSTDGCMGAVSHTITIAAGSVPTLSGPDTVCASGSGQTYRTQPGMTNYQWTIPPGATLIAGGTSSSDSAVVTWNTAGTHSITVNYTNPLSLCTPSSPALYPVTVTTQQPPTFLSGDTVVCTGAGSSTYSTWPGKINYAWTIPPEAQLIGGGTPADPYATVTWLVPGAFPMEVNFTEPVSLCTSPVPASLMITVTAMPGQAGNIGGPDSVCKLQTASYSVPAIPYAGSCLWQYTGTGVTVSGSGSDISLTFTPTATSGTLTVRGVNACGEGPVSPPLFIRVNENPVVTFTPCFDLVTTPNARRIALRGGTPYLPGQGVFSGNRVSFNSVTGHFEFDPQGATPGSYAIGYSYTNANGCGASAEPVSIQVQNNPFTCGDYLTDVRDGKKYKTVFLSGHCWMQENLRYGTELATTGLFQTDNCLPEKYCAPADASCIRYGGFYQWDELMDYISENSSKGLCPPEWHVPAEAEWQSLIDNLAPGLPLVHTNSTLGVKLKDPLEPEGFHARMGGLDYSGLFWAIFSGPVTGTMFWTSTRCSAVHAVARGLTMINPSISYYCNSRWNAYSLRCVKD